jgi:glycosyltransferase involved in cell wall biosynthesis
MHIVIDLQGAQCESRFRGIGRYSLSLARAIARNRGGHRVTIALNSVFAASIDPLKAVFEDILPVDAVRVWQGLEGVHGRDPANGWRRQAAECVCEAFLADLKPDVVLVSSLFEGFADDAVTSVPPVSEGYATAVILYDLIPLIFRDAYLTNGLVSGWYNRKLEHLSRSDFLLSISASSAREAVQHLGFPEDRIADISGAADPKFRRIEMADGEAERLGATYRISRPFALCAPGGFDVHKNVDGLIRAWAELPAKLRKSHQLVIASRIQRATERRLDKIRQKCGLAADDIVFTGYVPDPDLIRLYNLTDLCVFPSRHEGFGLPALEAMSCGAPTIGSDRSAVPEVIGRADAMFDPENPVEVAARIAEVLGNPERRAELSRYALERAPRFSWDTSARLAIDGMERLAGGGSAISGRSPATRPHRLAIVAPSAGLRAGAAHRLLALLPELAWRYEIDIVSVSGAAGPADIPPGARTCLDAAAFRNAADGYDRVLYCLGGAGAPDVAVLAREIPGAVLVTDTALASRLDRAITPSERVALLHACSGYLDFRDPAVSPGRTTSDAPLLADVASRAVGMLAGSEAVRATATAAGLPDAATWAVVPFTHATAEPVSILRSDAREHLALADDAFVVAVACDPPSDGAFLEALAAVADAGAGAPGLLLLDARSPADRDRLARKIAASGIAADPAAILDPSHGPSLALATAAADGALAFGANVEAGASGLMLDVADTGLPVVDVSSASPTADALAALRTARRGAERASASPTDCPSPRAGARALADALEAVYAAGPAGLANATRAIAAIETVPQERDDWFRAAEALSRSFPATRAPRQLLVDVSELAQRDARSGVQRVVRNILRLWLTNPPAGYRIEPVYATNEHGYRYATRFTLDFLGHKVGDVEDADVDFAPGDIFFMLDLQHHVAQVHRSFYQTARHHGVKVYFLVHDLLPILLDGIFPPQMRKLHEEWLSVVAESDGAFCVSRAVAHELADWIRDTDRLRSSPFRIGWFHHGADFTGSQSWTGLPAAATAILETLESRPTFLSVGTLEPRKGHTQTLEAFEALWAAGVDVNLVFVGKEGWLVEDLVKRLRKHPEHGRRLFWLEGVSDEYLEKVYGASDCLIAASRGEGFGLPLIEAAQYKVPILARDIPVFREVAGDHAFFFSGETGKDLAAAVTEWLSLHREDRHPTSDGMPWLTWSETAAQLARSIVEEDFLIELRAPKPEDIPAR